MCLSMLLLYFYHFLEQLGCIVPDIAFHTTKKPPAGSGGGAWTPDLYEQNAEREQELRGEIGGEIEYA